MRIVVAVLLLVAIATPTVDAHIAHPSQSTVLELSGFKLALTPVPSPVTAGTATRFVLVDVKQDPDRTLSEASIRITTTSDEPVAQHTFQQNGTVWETPNITFQEPGLLSARVIVEPENESQGRFSFRVYRQLPFEFAPIDATSDPVAKRPYTLTFRTVDPSTQEPQELVSDLGAMLFPAGTDPSQGDHFDPVMFTKNGTGTWQANVTFDFAGTWQIQLTSDSGGFHRMEAPPWQVDVLPPALPGEGGRAGSVSALLAMLACAAALGTRARTQ